MSLLHPNVAVALSYTGLRVQKRHPDAPLSTQASVVVVTLLHGVSVVLLPQPGHTRCRSGKHTKTMQLKSHYWLHWQFTKSFMIVGQQLKKKEMTNDQLEMMCFWHKWAVKFFLSQKFDSNVWLARKHNNVVCAAVVKIMNGLRKKYIWIFSKAEKHAKLGVQKLNQLWPNESWETPLDCHDVRGKCY